MAYKTEELKELALQSIREHKLHYIEDISAFIGIGKDSFYNHKLDEDDEIKEAIRKNKITLKQRLRTKWEDSDKPALQLALYKLIGSEEEAHRLNGSKTVIENNVQIKGRKSKEDIYAELDNLKREISSDDDTETD